MEPKHEEPVEFATAMAMFNPNTTNLQDFNIFGQIGNPNSAPRAREGRNEPNYEGGPVNGIISRQSSTAASIIAAAGAETPEVQNVVSTANLGCELDLKVIALKARNAEYNPKRFAAVIIRIRDPKTTALVFQSGKMVVTGAKSEDASKKAAKKFALIIKKSGFEGVRFKEFKVQNIVASCDVKFGIRLDRLQERHQGHCMYDPELFPGLIYRLRSPKIVLLIFASGKLVLTGAQERKHIIEAFQTILPALQECKRI
eukprot:TRINITY_DN5575_c0_g1_i11.p1 TRINITY_DN5575_c0_g1~~TRINITY_DN5575_c0_g1_i11.p1  ORF type:complete len:257 (+),score=47.34 TRINITY_DN5575_c0_g1_i11:115-885(+)